MLDIAEGLHYLHTLKPSIIHGDLKGVSYSICLLNLSDKKAKVNILITPCRRACLADFGVATAKDFTSLAVTSAPITRTGGTLRWQAPELLDPNVDDENCKSTLASDIYAYACVCYEVIYGYSKPQHSF